MSTVPVVPEAPSFWERQFVSRSTAGQIAFDVVFGIVLPLVCLYFDPIVFRASFGRPLLGSYAIVGAVAIGLGLLSLSAWAVIRRPPAFFAGLLAGGAIFAALLGLVLLPMSLIGLTAGIGVLGFTPLATAFVFTRNAVRAYRQARAGSASVRHLLSAVGLVVACGGPWAAQWYVTQEVSRATEMVLSADPAEAARGVSVLKRFRALADLDQLVIAYGREENPARRARLADSYRELTGDEIEHRLAILRD
jgi:hypothetical protein